MLFKDLKNIMTEADEAPPPADAAAPAAGTTPPAEVKPLVTRSKQSVADIKNATDGVRKESYIISTKLKTELQTSIPQELNVKSVEVNNNLITVVFDFSAGKDKFIVKRTGQAVTKDEVIAHIQTLVIAGLGVSGDAVDLKSEYFGGVLTITVKSKIEKITD